MNRILIVSAVVSLVASGALAAPNAAAAKASAAKVAKTTAAKKATKKKATTTTAPQPTTTKAAPAVAPAAPQAAATTLSVPSQSAGQTTATVAEAKKAAKPSPWGFKYRTENTVNVQSVMNQDSSAELEATDRAYINYKLNETQTISLVQYINHTWFGDRDPRANEKFADKQASKAFNLGDTYVQATDTNMATFGNSGITYGPAIRVYGGTGEKSRLSEKLGEVRFYNNFTKEFGKYTGNIVLAPYVPVFRNQTHLEGGKNKQNGRFVMLSGYEQTYDFTSVLGLELDTYYINTLSHPDDAAGVEAIRADSLEIDALINISATKNLGFAVGMINEPPIWNSAAEEAHGFQLFRPEETSYYMRADLKF